MGPQLDVSSDRLVKLGIESMTPVLRRLVYSVHHSSFLNSLELAHMT